MSATSPASLNLLTIRSGLEGRNQEIAQTEGSAGPRLAPLQVTNPRSTPPAASLLVKYEVSGYGLGPPGIKRKGPNVEVHPATADFPTDAAPLFTVDGERNRHFLGEQRSCKCPSRRPWDIFLKGNR
jgi:hypothetical protein